MARVALCGMFVALRVLLLLLIHRIKKRNCQEYKDREVSYIEIRPERIEIGSIIYRDIFQLIPCRVMVGKSGGKNFNLRKQEDLSSKSYT